MPSAYNLRTQHAPTTLAILHLYAQGHDKRAIVARLGVAPNTVADTLQDLQAQLALPDREALRAYAARLNAEPQ